MTKLTKAVRAQLRLMDGLTLADRRTQGWKHAHDNLNALYGEFGRRQVDDEWSRLRAKQ